MKSEFNIGFVFSISFFFGLQKYLKNKHNDDDEHTDSSNDDSTGNLSRIYTTI